MPETLILQTDERCERCTSLRVAIKQLFDECGSAEVAIVKSYPRVYSSFKESGAEHDVCQMSLL